MNNRRRFPIGHITQALLILGGLWLLIAPQWVGFAHNLRASRIDDVAGTLVIVAGAASFVLQWAYGLRELVERHRIAKGSE